MLTSTEDERNRRVDVAEIREQIPSLQFGVYLNTGG